MLQAHAPWNIAAGILSYFFQSNFQIKNFACKLKPGVGTAEISTWPAEAVLKTSVNLQTCQIFQIQPIGLFTLACLSANSTKGNLQNCFLERKQNYRLNFERLITILKLIRYIIKIPTGKSTIETK